MSNLVGIDLGTTFSAIAVLDGIGKPEIIPNQDGDRITPSAVHFPEDEPGTTLVGDVAAKAAAYSPDRVVQHVKRRMGDDFRYTINGTDYTPEQISSLILKKLAQDAAAQKGEIEQAVITVPANFRESARKATMDAGKLAGLEVTHIINEPTAAALFYATTADVTGRVLIYDLGGGTFDVTVADVRDRDVQVIASLGDQHLGGTDFDRKLVEIFQERYQAEFGRTLFEGDEGARRYLADAEELKKILSRRPKGGIVVNGPAGPLKIELTQKDFEEAISVLIAKTTTLIDGVLDEAKSQVSDIQSVLLVGGSTRIPLIERTLTKVIGKQPTKAVNVDEAIALGAAVYAGITAPKNLLNVAQSSAMSQIRMRDVCSNYYGTLTLLQNPTTGRVEVANALILKKNTPLPCSNTETFYTTVDGQTELDCTVTQSQFPETDPEFVNVLDKTIFSGLPPGRAAGRTIQVTFSYDVNERMHCVFLDVESGMKHEATINAKKAAADPSAQEAAIRGFVVE
ncbi:MAG: Hsp70 family protein [Planctomycetota bacterium]|jgi:molecular chaperone DnaK